MNKTVEIVNFPTMRVAAVEYRGPVENEYSAIMKLVEWRRENRVGPDQGRTIGIHYGDGSEYHIDICVSYDGEVEQRRDFPPFFHYVNVGPDVREEDMLTDVYLPIE